MLNLIEDALKGIEKKSEKIKEKMSKKRKKKLGTRNISKEI